MSLARSNPDRQTQDTHMQLLPNALLTPMYILFSTVTSYYIALAGFSLLDAKLHECRVLDPESRVWVYSLARTARLYGATHYRAQSFGHDIRANLKNVAIPGTGIALHLLFWTQGATWLFFLMVYPLAAFLTALFMSLVTGQPLAELFREHLLRPRHWFARWRLNCFVVAWHAKATEEDPRSCEQYALEGKGTFLLAAEAAGIPISPFLRDVPCLYAKHQHVEGGMGIHVLRSFTHGGDWILQPALTNSPELALLLPPGTPLSTLRVVTSSRHWLLNRTAAATHTDVQPAQQQPAAARSNGSQNGGITAAGPSGTRAVAPSTAAFSVLTVVLRAGRVGAVTDHDCVCFSVDARTGELSVGRSNQHWYKLGARNFLRIGDTFGKVWAGHPDGPGFMAAGRRIPRIDAITSLCINAHMRLLPDVPLIGWDVALTAEHGAVLLELNISCNFFLGGVDPAEYLALMRDYINALHSSKL